MLCSLKHFELPQLGREDATSLTPWLDRMGNSAILMPVAPHAARLREQLQQISGIGTRVERIRKEAAKHVISPYTIRLAILAYEEAKGLPQTGLGETGKFMGTVMNFVKSCRTVSQVLFNQLPPEPKSYVVVGRSAFGSPFFESLKEFCKHEQGAEALIHRVLGVSLADAKALAGELRQ